MFDYPSEKVFGKLKGFEDPEGLCSDASGNVFVTDFEAQEVLEFAHGGTRPIAILNDSGYWPFSCSVDPLTGNLAVANQKTATGGPGNIAVYANARGMPAYYSDPQIPILSFCGYDGAGNLFVDGVSGSSDFAELPKGVETFQNVALSFHPEAIQWDGQYLGVAAAAKNETSLIYRLNISNGKAKVAGSVPLTRGSHRVDLVFFWIDQKKVVGTFNGHIGTWKYPQGGAPTKFLGNYAAARGVTISSREDSRLLH
jgi:hypothetical protein